MELADSRARIVGRRVVVAAVVLVQLAFVFRGYHSDHKEFAFQMFSESSTWEAQVVRVTADERRIPVEIPWSGYTWNALVGDRGLRNPTVRSHADAGIDNQLAFLDSALDWVATHTPNDTQTRYYEATVTYWYDTHGPRVVVFRSDERDVDT